MFTYLSKSLKGKEYITIALINDKIKNQNANQVVDAIFTFEFESIWKPHFFLFMLSFSTIKLLSKKKFFLLFLNNYKKIKNKETN